MLGFFCFLVQDISLSYISGYIL